MQWTSCTVTRFQRSILQSRTVSCIKCQVLVPSLMQEPVETLPILQHLSTGSFHFIRGHCTGTWHWLVLCQPMRQCIPVCKCSCIWSILIIFPMTEAYLHHLCERIQCMMAYKKEARVQCHHEYVHIQPKLLPLLVYSLAELHPSYIGSMFFWHCTSICVMFISKGQFHESSDSQTF